MEIKSYGSGSKGNLYLVKNKNTNIILECGVDTERLRFMLNDNDLQYQDINACISSHFHQDHSLLIKDLDNYDIPCYCTYDTKIKYGVSDDNFIQLVDDKKYKIGSIQVIAFIVNHGQAECYGFIFKDKENMKLFITDFASIDKNLSLFNPDEIFIECNYINDLWQEKSKNESNSEDLERKYARQINTHMELHNLIKILNSNIINLSNCDTINLIHISQDLGNEEKMKEKVIEEIGIDTYSLMPNGVKI